MTEVTIYENIKKTENGDNFDLSDIMDGIRTGHWQGGVDKVRAESDFKARSVLKQGLPYFTGSGVFNKRNEKGLVEHNNRIIIDFDKMDDIDEAKSLLGPDKYSEYVFESCSGTGLAVIVKIVGKEHKATFKALAEYYLKEYGYKVDQASKDVSRPRYVSYDPDLISNPDSRTFYLTDIHINNIKDITGNMIRNSVDGEKHESLLRASRLMGGYIAGGIISEEEGLRSLEKEIENKPGIVDLENAFKTIRDGIENGKSQPISASQVEDEGDKGLDFERHVKEVYAYAHEINRNGRNWTREDVTNQCETHQLNPDRVEGIFNKVFKDNQDEFNINNKPQIAKVELFLSKNWDFVRNEVTQFIEFRTKKTKKYDKLNIDTVYRKVQYAGFRYALDKLKSLLRSDFIPSYNPFSRYFEALPDWDSETDYIDALANYVKVERQMFFQIQFKKALVRSIACTLSGYENRIVFVLVGEKQATGKSTFLRFLNPFGTEYYTEAPIRDNKDTEFSFAENFIYNLEELSSLNNTDVNRLKAMISKSVIKERKAYAVDAEEHPRRCNFWGSTNKIEFLTDTENTRWLCFNILGINWGYKKGIDIDKVWSQAYCLYKSGFDHQLTKDEEYIRDQSNKGHEVVDIEKELIMRFFKVAEPNDDKVEFFPNSVILRHIIDETDNKLKLNSRMIGKSMTQLGFAKGTKTINGHTVRGYYAITAQITNYEEQTEIEFDQNEQKMIL